MYDFVYFSIEQYLETNLLSSSVSLPLHCLYSLDLMSIKLRVSKANAMPRAAHGQNAQENADSCLNVKMLVYTHTHMYMCTHICAETLYLNTNINT